MNGTTLVHPPLEGEVAAPFDAACGVAQGEPRRQRAADGGVSAFVLNADSPVGGEADTPPPPSAVPLPLQGRNNERGFTLVEMMVVLVIIGLLAAVVIINVMPAADQARRTRIETDLTRIEEALQMYRLSNARYPSGQEGIAALVPQYIARPPADPWGNAYVYVSPGPNGAPYRIASLGADGREGGEGDDADIAK